MEGKTVILSVLIINLVMAQMEADNLCCPSTEASRKFEFCSIEGLSPATCLELSGCKLVEGACPKGFEHDILGNSGDAVNEYCKLGCASSVCGAMEALQNSDGSEIVNGAVEKCAKACSTFCAKGSTAGVGTA